MGKLSPHVADEKRRGNRQNQGTDMETFHGARNSRSDENQAENFGLIHHFLCIASRLALNSLPAFHSGNLLPLATW